MKHTNTLFNDREAEDFFDRDEPFVVGDLLCLKYLPDGDLLQEDWRIAALLDSPEFTGVTWKPFISGIVTRVNEEGQFEVWVSVFSRPFRLDSVYELVFQSEAFQWE